MPKHPEWWAEAQRLRAEGWKLIALAAYFGVHEASICYALYPHVRARQAARCRQRQANLTKEQRLHMNALDRASYARRKRKSRKKKRKLLTRQDRALKMAGDGPYHPPLIHPKE